MKDSELRRTVEKLSEEDQAAAVELLFGDLDLHNLFASKQQTSIANCQQEDLVPFIYGKPTNLHETLAKATKTYNNTEVLNFKAQVRYLLNPKYDGIDVDWPISKKVKDVLHFMLEGMEYGLQDEDKIKNDPLFRIQSLAERNISEVRKEEETWLRRNKKGGSTIF